MNSVLKSFWSKFQANPKNKNGFNEEVHFTNLYRYKFLSYFIVFYAIAILISDYQLNGLWQQKNAFSYFMLLDIIFVLASLFFIVLYFLKHSNLSHNISLFNRSLVYLLTGFLLCWGAINSAVEHASNLGFPSYIITVFIVTIFYYNSITLILFYILSFFVLILSTYLLNNANFDTFFMRYYSIIAITIAFVISRIQYSLLFKNYNFKKLISETNENLDILVRHRTVELSRMNRELQSKVSEYKETHEELDKNRSEKNAILDNLPYLAWLKDLDGHFINVNQPFADSCGLSVNEIIGKTDIDIWPEELARKYTEDDKKVMQTKQKIYVEEEIAEKTGTAWYETLKTPIFSEKNELIGTTGFARNITLQKELEAKLKKEKDIAEEADRVKTDFLANISHKIRTPMSSIIGFSELLMHKDVPESKKASFIEVIYNQGNHLLQIINDIIDISKIETGKMSINIEKCSLNELLQEIYLQSQKELSFKKRNSQVEIRVTKALSDNNAGIYTDPKRLHQVLSFLINNAIKYTHSGYIEFGYTLKTPTQLLFFVKDTGKGVSHEEHNLIFERYKNVSFYDSRNDEGSSLELPICKGLIKLMGGLIWVDSTVNEGSTFYFNLPYSPVPLAMSSKKNQTDSPYNWKGKTILLVEDDIAIYQLIAEIVSSTGVTLFHVENAVKAIELAQTNDNINVILMDIQLPGMNGYDAIQEIRKFNSKIPIIANTANALAEEKDKSFAAGCDDYLSKPFDVKLLLEMVNKYMV